jgi:hypothetical protein
MLQACPSGINSTHCFEPLLFLLQRRFSAQSAFEQSCPSAAWGVSKMQTGVKRPVLPQTRPGRQFIPKSQELPRPTAFKHVFPGKLMASPVRGIKWLLGRHASGPFALLPSQVAARSQTSFSLGWRQTSRPPPAAWPELGRQSSPRLQIAASLVQSWPAPCCADDAAPSAEEDAWAAAVVRMVTRRRPIVAP